MLIRYLVVVLFSVFTKIDLPNQSPSSWENNITKLGPPQVLPSQVLCGLSCSQNHQCGAFAYDADGSLCTKAIVRLRCIYINNSTDITTAGVYRGGVLPGAGGGVCEARESGDLLLAGDLDLWRDGESHWAARVVLSQDRRAVWSGQSASSPPTPPGVRPCLLLLLLPPVDRPGLAIPESARGKDDPPGLEGSGGIPVVGRKTLHWLHRLFSLSETRRNLSGQLQPQPQTWVRKLFSSPA